MHAMTSVPPDAGGGLGNLLQGSANNNHHMMQEDNNDDDLLSTSMTGLEVLRQNRDLRSSGVKEESSFLARSFSDPVVPRQQQIMSTSGSMMSRIVNVAAAVDNSISENVSRGNNSFLLPPARSTNATSQLYSYSTTSTAAPQQHQAAAVPSNGNSYDAQQQQYYNENDHLDDDHDPNTEGAFDLDME